MRLRIILIVLLIIFALFLIRQVTKKKVDIRYTLPWFLLVIALGILAIFPEVLSFITALVGITLPINLLFLSGLILALAIIYLLTIMVSRMNSEIKTLSQKVALLEKKLKDMDKGSE
jgi:hypothetical protein